MRPASSNAESIASIVYQRTCQTSFDSPGFCAVNLGSEVDFSGLRQLMVDVERQMAQLHQAARHQTLAYLFATRSTNKKQLARISTVAQNSVS